MRETQLDPDDLDRPDWNSLKANYSKHDVGEAYFKGRIEQMGLHVEHWGIDMRNHDEGLIFDDKMDLRLWETIDGQKKPSPSQWPSDFIGEQDTVVRTYVDEWICRALIDVKTKSNRDWLGITNIRHLAHYAHWANEHWVWGIPAAIYFTMVDMDTETVGEDNIIVPIPHEWRWEDLMLHYDRDEDYSLSWPMRKEIACTCPVVDRAFKAPDGNDVVKFKESSYENFNWIVEHVL